MKFGSRPKISRSNAYISATAPDAPSGEMVSMKVTASLPGLGVAASRTSHGQDNHAPTVATPARQFHTATTQHPAHPKPPSEAATEHPAQPNPPAAKPTPIRVGLRHRRPLSYSVSRDGTSGYPTLSSNPAITAVRSSSGSASISNAALMARSALGGNQYTSVRSRFRL